MEKSLKIWQRIGLILGGFVFSFLLVLLIITLFPNLIPSTDADRLDSAGVTTHIDFYYTSGDLFAYMPGAIKPPEDNAFLESFDVSWDDEGFRIPRFPADHYPIAVFGDSFVEGVKVPIAWPDRLGELLGIPVKNYGYRGFSPQDIAKVAEEFVPLEERQWIFYAYFSGNDLAQAHSTEDRSDPLTRLTHLAGRAEHWAQSYVAPSELPTNDKYAYPMPLTIGGLYYEMAFLDSYIWWQIGPEEGYENSIAMQAIGETIDTFDRVSAPETCKVLIFVPTKGQLYYKYIYEGIRQHLLALSHRPVYTENGHLELQPYHFDFTPEGEAIFLAHLHDQRNAIQALAEEKNWLFLDLLEPFEAAVAEGQLVYYRYDTHWNQAGNDLAAEIVAEFIDNHPECN